MYSCIQVSAYILIVNKQSLWNSSGNTCMKIPFRNSNIEPQYIAIMFFSGCCINVWNSSCQSEAINISEHRSYWVISTLHHIIATPDTAYNVYDCWPFTDIFKKSDLHPLSLDMIQAWLDKITRLSAWRIKGHTGYYFKFIDRPFCLQADEMLIHSHTRINFKDLYFHAGPLNANMINWASTKISSHWNSATTAYAPPSSVICCPCCRGNNVACNSCLCQHCILWPPMIQGKLTFLALKALNFWKFT